MGILQNLQKFRVRVRKCYRTHRSSGYCGTGVQNSQKFRAGTENAVSLPRGSGEGRTELTEVQGTGMNVVQNSHKFRVRVCLMIELPESPGNVARAYRTYRSSGQV